MTTNVIPHPCPVPPSKTIEDPKLILAYLSRGAVILVNTPTDSDQSTWSPTAILQGQYPSGHRFWTAVIPQRVFDALLTLRLIATTADSSAEQCVRYSASFKLPRIEVREPQLAATSAA